MLRVTETRSGLARGIALRQALAAELRASTTPMRSFTVTGTSPTARIGGHAFGHRRRLLIRQAPNAPECTRSLGQPQFRLISS